MRRLLGFALLLVAGCAATARPPTVGGALLAVGGGGMTDAIAARALALAGGAQTRLLIFPQASERPEAGAESLAYWRERGALAARVIDLAEDPARVRAEIAAADFLWFGGGDQNRLMASLREAGLIEPIRARWREGALAGGTSAGAAVLSAAMIVGGEHADLESVRAGGTTLADGLGLWSGVIVDQHFLARQRFNRLLAAVLDRPDLIGVGVDERTAVLALPDGRCEVIGEGAALILDARSARILAAGDGEPHAASAVALAIHRGGEIFRLESGGKAAPPEAP